MKNIQSILLASILAIGVISPAYAGATTQALKKTIIKKQVTKTSLKKADVKKTMKEVELKGGLTYTVLKEGTGREAKSGDTVSVHYVGTFLDGKKFDSSRDRGATFDVTIDKTGVIQGWHDGLKGMKQGEVRKLTIPSNLAYGPNTYGPIPGGSTLVFEIELVKLR